MLKGIFVAAFVLMIGNCFGQFQCLCTYGYPPVACIPDSIVELPCGLKLAICGNMIKTKGGVLFTDFSFSDCGKMNGTLTYETNKYIGVEGSFHDTCQVIVDHDTICIIKSKYIPVGENFEMFSVPYSCQDTWEWIDSNGATATYISFKILQDNIKLYSDSKIQKVWHIYEEMKDQNSPADMRLIGITFMAAISGSADLENKFWHLKDSFTMNKQIENYYESLRGALLIWYPRE